MPRDDWTPRIETRHHGREQQPVIVIDDYARDPEALVAEAAALSFRPIGPQFPGVRAPAPEPLVLAIRQSVAGLIRRTFGIEDELTRIECYFSLITTPASDLQPIQRLPHFDGLGPKRIARSTISDARRAVVSIFVPIAAWELASIPS